MDIPSSIRSKLGKRTFRKSIANSILESMFEQIVFINQECLYLVKLGKRTFRDRMIQNRESMFEVFFFSLIKNFFIWYGYSIFDSFETG